MFGQQIEPKKIKVESLQGQGMSQNKCTPPQKKDYETFQDIKDAADELFVRFNTAPHLYTKKDYYLLLQLLYKGLSFVYIEDGAKIGDNFGEIARVTDDKKIELIHPIAKRGSIVPAGEAASTLASVDYLSHYTLQWEEF